jgi:hypothetical protein
MEMEKDSKSSNKIGLVVTFVVVRFSQHKKRQRNWWIFAAETKPAAVVVELFVSSLFKTHKKTLLNVKETKKNSSIHTIFHTERNIYLSVLCKMASTARAASHNSNPPQPQRYGYDLSCESWDVDYAKIWDGGCSVYVINEPHSPGGFSPVGFINKLRWLLCCFALHCVVVLFSTVLFTRTSNVPTATCMKYTKTHTNPKYLLHFSELTTTTFTLCSSRAFIFEADTHEFGKHFVMSGIPGHDSIPKMKKLEKDTCVPLKLVVLSGDFHHMAMKYWLEGQY